MKPVAIQEPVDEQPQAKVLVLKFFGNRPRGLVDISHQIALANDLEAYLKLHEYTRLMDITPGTVELWDRLKSESSMLDRYIVIARVLNPGKPAYTILITVESFELLLQLTMESNLLRIPPILVEAIYRYHGITV